MIKKVFAIIMGAALVMGCAGGKKVDASKAILGDWEIVEAGGVPVESGFDKATISFDENGGVHGNTSINYFFGDYKLSGETLEFGNIGLTKMMGPTPDTERAVVDALNKGVKVAFEDNDNASILSKDGSEVLKMKRTELKQEEGSEQQEGTPAVTDPEPEKQAVVVE